MSDVHVVTVNFHTEPHVAGLVQSLRAQDDDAWRLTILDNGSDADGARGLRALTQDPRVEYLALGTNLGYLGAVHRRFGSVPVEQLPDWLVVSNPDIVLDPHFAGLVRQVDADVAAPCIRDASTGHDLNPFMRRRPSRSYSLSRRVIFANAATAQLWITASWLTHRHPAAVDPAAAGDAGGEPVIYAPHGALFALRRTYFERGGTLEHRPFLFGEEVTIAERARASGAVVRHVPNLRAEHTGHVTTHVRRPRQLLAHQRVAARYVDELIRGGIPA